MARVALVLVLIFSAALMFAVCKDDPPFIEAFPNPVVVGSPFKLVTQSDRGEARDCLIIFDSTEALSIYNLGQGKQGNFSFKVPKDGIQRQTWDAVAFTCRKDLKDFKATIECMPPSLSPSPSPSPSPTPTPTPTPLVSAYIGIELEGNLSLQLQTTRNLKSDDFVLTLSAQSSFIAVPLRDVTCSFAYTIDSGLIPKTGGPCANKTSTTTEKVLSCPFPKDFLHPGVQPLEIVWDGSKVQAGATISVTCDAKLGPISCPALASAKIVIPPPKLRIGLSKSEVVAGENVTLTATLGGDAGKDCTLELPDGTFHLTKAKEGADCTQVNKTNTYVCKTKEHTTAAYEIHVDSSETATGDKRKAVKLQCGDTHTEELVAVTIHSELDKPVLKLFRVGTQSFKVSVKVINKGPSDAVVTCTLKYPELFRTLDQVRCVPDWTSEVNTTTCLLFKGIAVAGKNGEGKVPDFEKNFTMPHVKFDGFPSFYLSCTPRGGEEKFVELAINYGNVTVTGTDVLKPDDKTVKQPDSYFWTYTIVIINLFLIALVVFVGMWWRNRAIARSMAGAERVDRFNEMEMFSSDHRPLSKAE